jgi:uncharacterized membrane protein
MIGTILYSLWVIYTIASLSGFVFLFAFALFAKWENAKHRKKIDEMFKAKSNLEEEGW